LGFGLKNTPADSKVALLEIGHVGYYSDRYIIDILGLVTPLNAKFVGQRNLNEWLKHYTPDYMLAHSPLWHKEHSAKVIALLGDARTVDDFNVPNFQLVKVNQLNNEIIPEELYSKTGQAGLILTSEEGKYITMLHAPGHVRFKLDAGSYDISGEFGILKHAYANPDKATDGVNFKIRLVDNEGKEEIVFERFLDPIQQPTDQGIQSLSLESIRISQPSEVYLHTEVGQDGKYDVSFWRNVQFKKLQ